MNRDGTVQTWSCGEAGNGLLYHLRPLFHHDFSPRSYNLTPSPGGSVCRGYVKFYIFSFYVKFTVKEFVSHFFYRKITFPACQPSLRGLSLVSRARGPRSRIASARWFFILSFLLRTRFSTSSAYVTVHWCWSEVSKYSCRALDKV